MGKYIFDKKPGWKFELLPEPGLGWYFYVWAPNHQDNRDYLQDTKEIAMKQAEEKYGIKPDDWKLVSSSQTV